VFKVIRGFKMARFAWQCRYEKGYGAWSDPDYERCGATSKRAFKTEAAAQKTANAHENKTGHNVLVWQLAKGQRY
jgi:hypothetical protein